MIQKNSMEYLKTVQGGFTVTCNLDWDFLLKSLSRKKIGRLRLASQLTCAGEAVGSFEGTFVVSDLDERS